MSDDDKYIQAVHEIARELGVDGLLSIPGLWEAVSEELNNDAIDRMREGNDDE